MPRNTYGSDWSHTMDSDGHVTIFHKGREVWCGSYEAFVADGDIGCPQWLADKVGDAYDNLQEACGYRYEDPQD